MKSLLCMAFMVTQGSATSWWAPRPIVPVESTPKAHSSWWAPHHQGCKPLTTCTQDPTCCVGNSKCMQYNEYYAQCRYGDCPKGWDCDPNKTPPPAAAPTPGVAGATCKVNDACTYDATCCEAGLSCYKHNQYYSQCRDSCPSGWACDPTPAPPTAAPPTDAPAGPPAPPGPPQPLSFLVCPREFFGCHNCWETAEMAEHCPFQPDACKDPLPFEGCATCHATQAEAAVCSCPAPTPHKGCTWCFATAGAAAQCNKAPPAPATLPTLAQLCPDPKHKYLGCGHCWDIEDEAATCTPSNFCENEKPWAGCKECYATIEEARTCKCAGGGFEGCTWCWTTKYAADTCMGPILPALAP